MKKMMKSVHSAWCGVLSALCFAFCGSAWAETIDLAGVARTITTNDVVDASTTYTNTGDTIVDLTVDVDEGARIYMDATIAGNIRLVKTGMGRLQLNAANTYAGGTLWQAGYLEANNTSAFGAAKTTVTCTTVSTGIHDGDLWFYLLVAGDYDYTFDFQNSNTVLWALVSGANVKGDIIDSTGAATGEIWFVPYNNYGSNSIAGYNRPAAALGAGLTSITVQGSAVAKWLDVSTCYRRTDWRGVPGKLSYLTSEAYVATYDAWKAITEPSTRAQQGTIHFQGAQASFASFGAAGNAATYTGMTVSQANALNPSMFFVWGKTLYGKAVNVDLNGTAQTVNYLSGASMADADSGNQRLIQSTNPATLTLAATQSATTCARLDGAVSLVYDAKESCYTQSFVAARAHQTSGSLTAKKGVLELGGTTTWQNLSKIEVLDEGVALLSTTVTNAFNSTLSLAISGRGKISTDRDLTVLTVLRDGSAIETGTYTASNCDWVTGEGSVTVMLWGWTQTDYEAYVKTHDTIEIAEGKTLTFIYDENSSSTITQPITGKGTLEVAGSGGTIVFAGANTFSGGFVLSGNTRVEFPNACALGAGTVTVDAQIGNETTRGLWFTGSCIYTNQIVVNKACYLNFKPSNGNQVWLTGEITATADFKLRTAATLYVSGDIHAAGQTIEKAGNMDYKGTIYLYGHIVADTVRQNCGDWGRNAMDFSGGPSEINVISPGIGWISVDWNDPWSTNTVMAFYDGGSWVQQSADEPKFYFGADVTANRIRAGGPTLDYGTVDADTGLWHYKSKTEAESGVLIRSWEPMTLTLKGTEGSWTHAKICDSVSLTWDPVGDYVFALSNRTHTTTGKLTVKGGTLLAGRGTTFPNVTALEVAAGAKFVFDTNRENGFTSALQTIIVGDSETSEITLPEGLQLSVATVIVDGVPQAAQDLTPANTPWLKGSNVKITVPEYSVNYWLPAAGDWSAAANWTKGVPSVTLAGNVLAWDATDVTATISTDVGKVGEVNVGRKGAATGTATVKMVDGGALVETGSVFKVNGGGRLEITGGTLTIMKDFVLSSDGEGTLILGPGANLTVSGNLDARTGSKLVIDARGYTGTSKTLATFGGTTTSFDAANVTFLQDAVNRYRLDISSNRIRLHRIRGLIIMCK